MKSITKSIESLFNKKIGGFELFASIGSFILLLLIALQYYHCKPFDKGPRLINQAQGACPPPAVVKYNMTEYKYARPLLVVDVLNQGDMNGNPLGKLQSGINTIIELKKEAGTLISASVYVQQLNTGNFITINNEERYHPASLRKIPTVIVVLRESELIPGLLNKELTFNGLPENNAKQDYPPSEEIKQGRKYTIRELVNRSIIKSDNKADYMLESGINKDICEQFYKDLGAPELTVSPWDYTISATEYSRFMRVLYNATYLSSEDADYALSVLTKSEFKEGMMKYLPAGLTVSHKFGEYGVNDQYGRSLGREMHESGIIYIPNNPILVTIMTKGNDTKQLTQVISEISKYIYDMTRNRGS